MTQFERIYNSKIFEAPPGWRWLTRGEKIQKGDELYECENKLQTPLTGLTVGNIYQSHPAIRGFGIIRKINKEN